jgi:hypothetical protein
MVIIMVFFTVVGLSIGSLSLSLSSIMNIDY